MFNGKLIISSGREGNACIITKCSNHGLFLFKIWNFFKNFNLKVHQPSGGAQGMASDVLIMAEELSRNRERLNEIYAHHTGQTVEKIAETLDRFFLIF